MKNNNNVIYDERIPKLKEEQRKQKNNRTFIFLILLFFALILIILYFQSPFSKLSSVEISGHVLVTEEELLQSAKLELGMSYFQFTTNGIEKRIEQLIQVADVHVQRRLPNKLEIEVVEWPIVAFWHQDQDLYPILSSGHILFQRKWDRQRVQAPILSGWPTKEGILELSKELYQLPNYVTSQISEITLTPIDSDPYRLTLYMEDGNEVRTSIRKFADNMSWYPIFLEQNIAEGKPAGIYNLLDGKWFEDPSIQQNNEGEEQGREGEG